MKQNETHVYCFEKLDTKDSGETLGSSFWKVLKELGNSEELGEGRYRIWNLDTGNCGVYEIKDKKCKRISTTK